MELLHKESNFNSSEVLHQAQLIADTFSEALKQNNCLLILPLSLHHEIKDALKDIEDIDQIIENDSKEETYTSDILDSVIDAIADSKAKCYGCKLTMPNLKFNVDHSFSFSKLSASLSIYKETIKFDKIDLCQPSFAIRNNCLPDILRLIVLLLTAYSAIMTLKNIQSISLAAFIKGILTAVIGKIVASLNISVSIGSTNVACIIEAFKEISMSLLPTHEEIYNSLSKEDRDTLQLKNIQDMSFLGKNYAKKLNAKLNNTSEKLQDLENNVEKLQERLSTTFTLVSDTLEMGVNEINDYIQNLIGLKTSFDCEAKRSGTDVSEVIQKVNKLIQIINMLSAVALSVAKKESRDRICSAEGRINSLSKEDIEALQYKDMLEELYGKEVEIINNKENGLQVLLYEKPKDRLLPKIDIFDCSIDDFIEAHTLDNVISTTEKFIKDTLKTNPNKIVNPYIPVQQPSQGKTYTVPYPSEPYLTSIDNIVNILYDDPIPNKNYKQDNKVDDIIDLLKPTSPSESSTTVEDIFNPIKTDNVSAIIKNNNPINSSLNCKSIDDVLTVLDQLRR